MTQNELRRMGRRELIELIAVQKKRELELEKRIEQLEQELAERKVRLSSAGSIAEAALSLSGVFEAAQTAADSYLQSIYAIYNEMDDYVANTRAKCERLVKETERRCSEKLASAGLVRNKAE